MNIVLLTEAKVAQQRHAEVMRRMDALRDDLKVHESEVAPRRRAATPHVHTYQLQGCP